MATMLSALSRFQDIVTNRHQYAQDWKARTCGKIFGYFCTYVPEEILLATNSLPVRVFGSEEYPQEANRVVADTWCAFSRDCLSQGLLGRYRYLDGIIYANTCYHMMQTFDAWRRHVPVGMAYLLDLPWDVVSRAAAGSFERELVDMRDAVGQFMGKRVEEDEVERGIQVLNENRRLLRELYDLRKSLTPPITGEEVLWVMLANQVMDKAEHSTLLRELLTELPGRQPTTAGPRLMVVSSELQDPSLMQAIESFGAQVVIDEHCVGTRYFWNEVPPGDSAQKRIAERYVRRPPCPLKDCRVPRKRVDHLLYLAREFKVGGVLFLTQKFCDPHGWDVPYLQKALEKNGMPSLALEITIPNTIGTMRVRLEAFYEMLTSDQI